MATVLNKHRDQPGPGAVYIGRGSKWGNPFVIGRDGDREEVCDRYEYYLDQAVIAGHIAVQELAALHGRDLLCFCSPQRCHGDYLALRAEQAWHFLYGRGV